MASLSGEGGAGVCSLFRSSCCGGIWGGGGCGDGGTVWISRTRRFCIRMGAALWPLGFQTTKTSRRIVAAAPHAANRPAQRERPRYLSGSRIVCPRLKLAVQVELQNIDAVGLAKDFVGAEPAQGRPGVVKKSQFAGERIAFGVGAAEMEIGIVEGRDHRIRFEVFIPGGEIPLPGSVTKGLPNMSRTA